MKGIKGAVTAAVLLVGIVALVIAFYSAPAEEPPGEIVVYEREKEPEVIIKPAEPEPEPAPKPEPEPSPAEGLSLREKILRLFIVKPETIAGQHGEGIADALEKYPIGGLIIDRSNIESREQLVKLLRDAGSAVDYGLILTCDEEGGVVSRLMDTVGTTKINSMYSYRAEGPDKARENARTIASDMAELGFNLDLAPVADVWSNPANTVIGRRAYSDDYSEAAELIPAAVEGFHEGGVACTLKHFPGHGDTSEDSHTGAAYVTKTLDELRSAELLPFGAGIDAGADAVMIGHLTLREVDDVPATFSYKIVTELLRNELGFEGVIMTDALGMGAVKNEPRAYLRALLAGADILLMPADLDAAVEEITAAVESGELSESEIDERVRRIDDLI